MNDRDTGARRPDRPQAGASFGAWLRLRRRALDLTQAELAAAVGISRSYLRKIETDQRRPSREVAEILAAELAVPADQRDQFLAAARGKELVAALGQPAAQAQPTAAQVANLDLPPLPRPPSPFIGRSPELERLQALLAGPSCRLLTLIGPGGIGKTRLAVELARREEANYRDGVCFVPVADVRDPQLLLPAVGRRLGLREQGSDSPADALIRTLRPRKILMVLDNMEQVVDAAPDVAELLAAAPELKIIVTSRELLRVSGEQLYWVPPLELPHEDATLEQIDTAEAVRFFLSQARRADPDLLLDEDGIRAAAAICRRLDGLPLALELAVARLRHLSPQQILGRLETRLPLLTGGPRDAPARQQTLAAALAWSYDLLPNEEQQLFTALGMFRGGFSVEAAGEIGEPGGSPGVVLERITSLVDKSLVRRAESLRSGRFYLFGTLAEFARLKLQESGRAPIVEARHAHYYLALAERAAPRLHGREQDDWLGSLEADHSNFQQALTWFIAHSHAEEALRLVAALGWYWTFRGHVREGFGWLTRALALEGEVPPHVRLNAISSAGGRLTRDLDAIKTGRLLIAEALSLAREVGDRINEAWLLAWWALYGVQQKPDQDVSETRADLRRASRIFAEEGHEFGLAWSLTALGIADLRLGRLEESLRLQQESAAAYEVLGNPWGLRHAYMNLGLAYYELGAFVEARASLLSALEHSGGFEDIQSEANILCSLALLLAENGRLTEALTLLSALQTHLTTHNTWLGYPESVYYRELLAELRRTLDIEDFERSWAAGERLTRSEARTLAVAAP